MNINTWLGCGRLTKDADFNVTQKGTSMAKFRMAVNDRRNDDTLYLKCSVFRQDGRSFERSSISRQTCRRTR